MKQTNARTGDTVGYVVVVAPIKEVPWWTIDRMDPMPRAQARRRAASGNMDFPTLQHRIARVVLDK